MTECPLSRNHARYTKSSMANFPLLLVFRKLNQQSDTKRLINWKALEVMTSQKRQKDKEKKHIARHIVTSRFDLFSVHLLDFGWNEFSAQNPSDNRNHPI